MEIILNNSESIQAFSTDLRSNTNFKLPAFETQDTFSINQGSKQPEADNQLYTPTSILTTVAQSGQTDRNQVIRYFSHFPSSEVELPSYLSYLDDESKKILISYYSTIRAQQLFTDQINDYYNILTYFSDSRNTLLILFGGQSPLSIRQHVTLMESLPEADLRKSLDTIKIWQNGLNIMKAFAAEQLAEINRLVPEIPQFIKHRLLPESIPYQPLSSSSDTEESIQKD